MVEVYDNSLYSGICQHNIYSILAEKDLTAIHGKFYIKFNPVDAFGTVQQKYKLECNTWNTFTFRCLCYYIRVNQPGKDFQATRPEHYHLYPDCYRFANNLYRGNYIHKYNKQVVLPMEYHCISLYYTCFSYFAFHSLPVKKSYRSEKVFPYLIFV